jgi:hypothetical protein
MKCITLPDPDVVATTLPDGDSVLLHLRTHEYFSLNATGSFLWKLMETSTDQEAMSEALSDRFAVTPREARDSVLELLRELEAHQLIGSPQAEDLTGHE